MENNEIKKLIETFKEYRDLIGPIEQSLKAFSLSFDSIKDDIHALNSGFDGGVQGKLDKIYKELSTQSEKAKTLASEVDRFISSTNKYVAGVDNLINFCARIEDKIKVVDGLQAKAENQIEKLDTIIEEKRRTYDIRQLEKKLESYNVGVQKVSDYINKDVADVLKNSSDRVNEIAEKNNNMYNMLLSEKESIDNLVLSYNESSKLLQKVVENNEVNEQYLFEMLDKWAEDRRIKIKK